MSRMVHNQCTAKTMIANIFVVVIQFFKGIFIIRVGAKFVSSLPHKKSIGTPLDGDAQRFNVETGGHWVRIQRVLNK